MKMHNVEDIYILSPMQQGMLFHVLHTPDAGMYFEQDHFILRGDLNVAAFVQSWQQVIDRHPILRTAFIWEGIDTPLQIVRQQVTAPWTYHDWRDRTPQMQEAQLNSWLTADRRQGMTLTAAPLLRLTLIQLADEHYHFIVSSHHLLLDGWSGALVLQEVFTCYDAACRGTTPVLPPVRPYRDYIAWLQRQDMASAERFWRGLLEGISAPTPLGIDRHTTVDDPADQEPHAQEILLPQASAGALQRFAKQQRLTVNTLVQGAWAIALSHYSGQRDVVFGAPVSGRPVDLSGVEQMVGLFINTLPIRVQVDPSDRLAPWLHQLQAQQIEARQYEYSPLTKIQGWSQAPRGLPLFESIVVFENYPVDAMLWAERRAITISPVESIEKGNYPLTIIVELDSRLRIQILYNPQRFAAGVITRMLSHLQTLLERMAAQPEQRLAELSLLSLAERQQILYTWNATATPYPQEACIHQLIESQVTRTPHARAVSDGATTLTYVQLNTRANQLAHYLQQHGVGPDVRVGVCLPRSPALLVALLAILKSGGVYVPLDPAYPPARLQFIMIDAGPAIVITETGLLPTLPAHGASVIALDRDAAALAQQPTTTPVSNVTPDHLAYVIYTSGSTGVPKGALLAHRGLCNVAIAQARIFGVQMGQAVLQFAPLNFDASLFEMIMALNVGACLILAAPGLLPGPDLLDLLQVHDVAIVTLTPATLAALPQAALPALHTITVAGEACPPTLVDRWAPGRRFFNLYGPTEATIWTTCAPCVVGQPPHIGRPIANTQVYILNPQLQPAAAGVVGELYIGGVGLARGYHQRPGLTAEKFIPHPFSDQPGMRLYKTGDLGRYQPDGAIEFLGRRDHQVKVRGFRIELGEIEAALLQISGIRDGVVIVREDRPGVKQIVAYIVGDGSQALLSGDLRAQLKSRLPEYMTPAIFVILEALPLTPNGKIDRKALPAPDHADMERMNGFVAPQTPVEQLLATIWAEVLGLPRVGMHDNFFSIGGDSILSLQVVAKARQSGISLTPKHIFQHETIARLAAVAGTSAIMQAEQGLVVGALPLTPIQHWFFDLALTDVHHFNQSIWLTLQPDLSPALLERALLQLVHHHDALHMRFAPTPSGWQARIEAPGLQSPLVVHDLSTMPASARHDRLESLADEYQASLNLIDGSVMRAVFFRLGDGSPNQLMLILHHLVIDGISWRILLEDLHLACTQLLQGQAVQLPLKTTSFKQWAEHLSAYAQLPEARQEAAYWLAQTGAPCLPMDRQITSALLTQASTATIAAALDVEETRALLHETPTVYRTQINDLLLAALAHTLANWTNASSALLLLEGHGREDLFADLDISRTVGWFTSAFPILLDLANTDGPGAVLKTVKEQLRQTPRKGVGYGILRYLNQDATLADQLAALPQPEVSFNYLGQFDQAMSDSPLFALSDEAAGIEISARNRHLTPLEVNAHITQGQLQIQWKYSLQQYRRETIARLASDYCEALRAFITHCQLADAGGCTPSDFPLAHLNQTQIDKLIGLDRNIEDLYPLTPMQQAMLLHSVLTPNSLGFIQEVVEIRGPFQPAAFRHAWQRAIDRHAVLRTEFRWQDLDTPLQLVRRNSAVPYEIHDWRGLATARQEARLDELLHIDRMRDFDLGQAPLLRITLIQCDTDRFYYVQSCHHVLLDGWCHASLQNEVFAHYYALTQGRELRLERPHPYRDYIAWLQAQNSDKAEGFWRAWLRGFTTPSRLVLDDKPTDANGTEYLILSRETTKLLQELASRYQVTLSILMQGSWAIVLSMYSGAMDVVFGITVAGRPAELPGAQSMLGLFINNLPLRIALAPHESLGAYFRRLQTQLIELQQYEFTPLADIQRWSELPWNTALFESLLVFENYPGVATSGGDESMGLQIRSLQQRGSETSTPFTMIIDPLDELKLTVLYDPQRFTATTIQRVLTQYQTILDLIVTHSNWCIGAIDLLSDAERHQLSVWDRSADELPDDPSIVRLFEAQVARNPHKIAIRMADLCLNYAEIQQRIDWLALALHTSNIANEQIIGIYVDSPLAFVVGMLGVTKAGGTWMHFDPALPSEQFAQRLARCGVQVLLTQASLIATLPADNRSIMFLDIDCASASQASPSAALRDRRLAPDALACVVEEPQSERRIGITQRSLVLSILGVQQQTGISTHDGICVLPSGHAAPSGIELLLPLLCGARLVIAPSDPATTLAWLDHTLAPDITVLYGTPETWRRLLHAGWRGDLGRAVWSSGGPLDANDAAQMRRRCASLWTLYQPGGISLWAAVKHVVDDQPAVFSRPLPHMHLTLLDAAMRLLPTGIPAQIHLGGATAPRAYREADAAAPNELISNPLIEADAPLWASGDLARFHSDYQLELLGRIDQQTVLHGYRIDLAALERVLAGLPEIESAVVMIRQDTPGEQRLVAYLKTQRQPAPTIQDLRAALLNRAPQQAIPSDFVFLDTWPLTEQGALDRSALPAPGLVYGQERLWLHGAIMENHDIIEFQLTEIWEQILNVRPIHSTDNFFDLGGASLTALRLIGQIQERFGLDLPMSVLFKDATIMQLAQRIRDQKGVVPWSPLVEIQPNGSKPPFFCVHGVGGNVLGFVDLARRLDPDQPFYGIQITGLDGQQEIPATIAAMASAYIEEIRQVQPVGPYFLGGLSFGGYVAFEMARQLQAQGQEVGLLVLFDSWALTFQGQLLLSEIVRDDVITLLGILSDVLNMYGHTHNVHQAELELIPSVERVDYIMEQIRSTKLMPASELEQLRRVLTLHYVTNWALRSYVPQGAYRGRITIMGPQDLDGAEQMSAHPALGTAALLEEWAVFSTESPEIYVIPGTHTTMMLEPNVQVLAARLTECMSRQIERHLQLH